MKLQNSEKKREKVYVVEEEVDFRGELSMELSQEILHEILTHLSEGEQKSLNNTSNRNDPRRTEKMFSKIK